MDPDAHWRADAARRVAAPRIKGIALTDTLVLDAGVVVQACLSEDGFDPLGGYELVAPSLLSSEVASTLHLALSRRLVSQQLADAALERFLSAPIRLRRSDRLLRAAWRLATELGWGRTYDAEYVALARALGCRLVTIDARLHRGAARVVSVVGPTELA